MQSLRNFWRRNKRKVFVTAGVLGGGYVLYKVYAAHSQRLLELDQQLQRERDAEELVKIQLQVHFENIQRIVDTTTLPYAMHYLRDRLSEEFDLSDLMNRLQQSRGQSNSSERLELWEKMKVLSFTRMVVSLWTMTVLNLYSRVQVNILGRHLYIDTARGMESSSLLDDVNQFDSHGQQEFLSTADYLSNYGMVSLIPNMQKAAAEVLKGKQLTDIFNTSTLRETIMQILDTFLSSGEPHHWLTYLIPENPSSYKHSGLAHSKDMEDTLHPSEASKLKQLIGEAVTVLTSEGFRNVMEISLRSVLDILMEDVASQPGGIPSSGIPLARLFARVSQMGPLLLEEPSRNKYIQSIQSLPEVELFYTLLYANMPLQISESA